jgi:hypothetical protein
MTAQDIRLQANFTSAQGSYDEPTQTWTHFPSPLAPQGGTWNYETQANAGGAVYAVMWTMSTIDLGGLELEKETFFPVGSSIQDPNIYYAQSPDNSRSMHVFDLITDKLINPLDVVGMVSFGDNMQSNYGMLGDGNDATTIIMGSYRFKAGNSNLTYPQLMRTEQASIFSSGEPTAASRLYCYRIIVPFVEVGGLTDVRIPAARFYLTGVRDNEPDLEYMMRLKRSYELDQTQS